MYRRTQETEIEKQQYKRRLFKELKQRKIFGKFCLAVAEAYASTYTTTNVFGERIYKKHSHDDAEYYIAHSTRIDARFLNAVEKEWKIRSNILIQP